MLQIDQQFDLYDQELATIKELCALAPLEIVVQYLCQEVADLVLAENVIAFTLKKLRDLSTPIGKTVFQKFEILVLQRRNIELAHLIECLKLADFLDETHDEFDVKIQKTKITTLATNLMKRLFKANEADQDDDGFEIEVEEVAEENKEVSKMEISLYDELSIFLQEQDP